VVLFTRTVSVGTVVLYFVHISVLSSFVIYCRHDYVRRYHFVAFLLSYFKN